MVKNTKTEPKEGFAMTYLPDREYVLEAVQEKRRGGWDPESIPGRNGNEEGTRAVEALEANAVTNYLHSDQAREHLAKALADRRLQATPPWVLLRVQSSTAPRPRRSSVR